MHIIIPILEKLDIAVYYTTCNIPSDVLWNASNRFEHVYVEVKNSSHDDKRVFIFKVLKNHDTSYILKFKIYQIIKVSKFSKFIETSMIWCLWKFKI